jgi:hypothetical protein
MRDCKLVTVKVQTNMLELLGVDDLDQRISRRRLLSSDPEEEYVEENYDRDYTRGIINNVINGLGETQFKKKRIRLPKQRLM